MINRKNKRNDKFYAATYFLKWLSIISLCLIAGGVLSFGLTLICAYYINGRVSTLDPIWIVGMIPMMTIVAIPLTLLVYKKIRNSLGVLLSSIHEVASGNLDSYIPTAGVKDFKSVYENFNTMLVELQKVQVLRADMINILSHEIKTPISSINGFAEMLLEDDLTEEKKRAYTEIIIKESARVADLTKNMLLLSKLDSESIITNTQKFDLSKHFLECAIALEPEWSKKELEFSADVDENITITADLSLFESLWTNLISNAIKFTEKGEISISLKKKGKEIIAIISDTGIGLSEKEINKIFDKHYQVSGAFSSSGNGLGLTIVRRIVKLFNGNIKVESDLGKGTSFIITFAE